MTRVLHDLAEPPMWISKPLSAMAPGELRDLLAALYRETPPDTPLLRAVEELLALLTTTSPPDLTAVPSTAQDDGALDDEDEDDSWALEA